MNNHLILKEEKNSLLIQERKNGILITIMKLTSGSVTNIQIKYFESNVKGRIKQVEADIILKYFYGLE